MNSLNPDVACGPMHISSTTPMPSSPFIRARTNGVRRSKRLAFAERWTGFEAIQGDRYPDPHKMPQ